MNAQEIIDYIASSPKRTPVKIYINLTAPVDFGSAQVFGEGGSRVVFGDWAELAPILEANRERITDLVVENDRRNSGVPLLDLKGAGDHWGERRHHDGGHPQHRRRGGQAHHDRHGRCPGRPGHGGG